MTPPKTFEEWEKTISHETMYLTGFHRDMARRGWLACEASHAAQRERADRLAEAVEKLRDADDAISACETYDDMIEALHAYRNKEDAKV